MFTQKFTYITEVGTTQGGILSPLLSNIYLHELDKYMEELSIQYQGKVKSESRRKNPAARKLLSKGLKSEYYRMRIPSRDPYEMGYRNFKYIRSADDLFRHGQSSKEIEVTHLLYALITTVLRLSDVLRSNVVLV